MSCVLFLCATVCSSTAFAQQAEVVGTEADSWEMRVGADAGMAFPMFSLTNEHLSANPGFGGAEIAGAARISDHHALGVSTRLGLLGMSAGIEHSYTTSSWVSDGWLILSGAHLGFRSISCGHEECPTDGDHASAEFNFAWGPTAFVGGGYRWTFFDGKIGFNLGLALHAAYLTAVRSQYVEIYEVNDLEPPSEIAGLLWTLGPRYFLSW